MPYNIMNAIKPFFELVPNVECYWGLIIFLNNGIMYIMTNIKYNFAILLNTINWHDDQKKMH